MSVSGMTRVRLMDKPRGSGIVRHQSSHEGFVAARGGREGFAEAIERHIEQHVGPVDFVYHDMMPHRWPCMCMSWRRPRRGPTGRLSPPA